MKGKILRSFLFLALFLATAVGGHAQYQVQPESPSTGVENVDEGKSEDWHRVTFENQATGRSVTRYYEDGTVLSMEDLADLSANPEEMYLANGQYLSWTDSSQRSLSNHIPVTGDLVLTGTAAAYENGIRLSAQDNQGFTDRSYETAQETTLASAYEEKLSAGAQFVGLPDNIVYLDSEAYNTSVELKLMAVSATNEAGILGLRDKTFSDGYYVSVTHVDQTSNSGFAVGQAVNIRLKTSSGMSNGYGAVGSDKKFSTNNGDITIGLANPEANSNEGGKGSLTPYKHATGGTMTYNSSKNTYSTNYCANRIVLQNDVIFSGSITVGGITGYYGKNIDFSQSGFQGYINGSYCEIDLNGYDLILTNGTSLISYGSITDSSRFKENATDTGSLVLLPGATLQSPFVLEDIFLPLSAAMSYFNSNAPFNFYRCPYLDCKTVFYAGSHFQGEYKVDLAGLTDETMGTTGIVHFLGTSGDANCLLVLSSGKIVRNVNYNDQLLSFANDLFNQEIHYSVIGADLDFANWMIPFTVSSLLSMNFDSRKAQFFIPFYYKVDIIDSNVSLDQELVFMTGSYLNVDKDSTLTLSYSEVLQTGSNSYFDSQSYQSVGGLTFLDAFYFSETSTDYYPLYDSRNTNLLRTNSGLWSKLDNTPAYCNFDGRLVLEENPGVIQYHFFRFGGQMDILRMQEFQDVIEEWNANASHRKVELFGNYFMLGPNTAQGKTDPGDVNYFYVRGFYTPPLMTRDNEVLVDVTTTDHVVRGKQQGTTETVDSSAGTTFVSALPTATYDSATGIITDQSGSTYAFLPDYSWSANWDNNHNSNSGKASNFYGATSLTTNDLNRYPDDLAGSFWQVTVHGNYVSVNGPTIERYVIEEGSWPWSDDLYISELTFNRPYNIFYRGSFVYVQGSLSGNSATTNLYRYAGGKTGDARSSQYNMTYANSVWSISGKA